MLCICFVILANARVPTRFEVVILVIVMSENLKFIAGKEACAVVVYRDRIEEKGRLDMNTGPRETQGWAQ